MILLVGLGNPGARYAGNRHNIGFLALDAIADRHSFAAPRRRFQGELRDGLLGGVKALALKPMTYMNESGRAVGEALRFHRLTPQAVVVFHDELDLAPGKLRVKAGGGSAGHNGLKSITAHIGAEYRRVRLGIGHPGHKDRVHGHVLSDFAKSDAEWLGPLLAAIAENAGMLAGGEDEKFASRVHAALQPSDPARPPAEARVDTPAPRPDRDAPEGALAAGLRRFLGRDR